MTDRIKGCWVAFEEDIREDDVMPLLSAIGQLRGVLSVESSPVDISDFVARERVRAELTNALFATLRAPAQGRNT